MQNNPSVQVIKADITRLDVDAIVNAANNGLLGGGGVDGAIHRAAGPDLLKACSRLNGCETGMAKITKAYLLPCKYVIHTVGPVWKDGNRGEAEKLASCYKECLKLAHENNIRSIAFPNISTGIYGYPREEAARIAIHEVRSFMEQNQSIELILFVCFGDENYELYKNILDK